MTQSKNANNRKGRLWKTDKLGFLQNDADLQGIQPEFKQLVEEVQSALLENLLPSIHSLYLTGSVSRGIAMPGVSDLDAFVVLEENAVIDDQLSYFSDIKAGLLNRHPEVTDIQMELWEWQDLFGLPKEFLSEYQVVLKLNSICLYGEDLSSKILPIKPDVALANTEVIQLKTDIKQVLKGIAKDPSPHNIKYWCRRIMKNLIRAGFYMVIPREKGYTRDLSLCIELFLKYFPEMKEVRVCQHYVDSPMSEASELEYFLKYGFGSKLLAKSAKWLDENNPERHLFLRRISY